MYLTPAEFVARYTEREARLLTDEAATGQVNTARLQTAIDEAEGIVNGYLARRYALPLRDAASNQPVVPEMLRRLTGDIARYTLTGTHVTETDAIRRRYEDAVKLLDKLASGQVHPGVELALTTSAAAPVGGASSVRAPARVFGPDVLGSML